MVLFVSGILIQQSRPVHVSAFTVHTTPDGNAGMLKFWPHSGNRKIIINHSLYSLELIYAVIGRA